MLYKNFEHDFVERTINNLKWIDTKNSIDKTNKDSTIFYEFTNLINQCLGLILLPSQFSDKIFLKNFPQELSYYGVGDHIVNKIKDNKQKTLSNVMRHIRNGIAHGHIQQHSDNNNDITDIRILDANRDVTITNDNDAHTIIEFTIQEFTTFTTKVAKEYCKLKNEELKQATSL